MVKLLKKRFVALASIAMLIMMILLITGMNLVNYRAVVKESDQNLQMITNSGMPKGIFHDINDFKIFDIPQNLPPGMSQDTYYESRFFYLVIGADGYVVDTNISRIASVDEEMAEAYAKEALLKDKERGFVDQFRFCKIPMEDVMILTFLDCGRKLSAFRTFMWISIFAGLLCCLVAFMIFLFASGKIIRPIALSYEKQKSFITDAGHEIKTPLTIINANIDLLEAESDPNEYTTELRNQTQKLAKLTNDLVYLAKMDEPGAEAEMIEFPLSDLISETADEFRSIADSRGINYEIQIEPGIIQRGSPDNIERLTCILLENAMKYTSDEGNVKLTLAQDKKKALLSVYNTTKTPVDPQKLMHVFDRFYRLEESRNSQTGGHGIGLSVAKAIVDKHQGSITAKTITGNDFLLEIGFTSC